MSRRFALRRFWDGVFAAAALFLIPFDAHAQRKERRGLSPEGGVHYGLPLKWSFAVGISRPDRSKESAGTMIAAEPGLGGWRASLGYFNITGNLGTGYVARVSVLRTNNTPWRAPVNTTFVGGELQYMPAFVMGLRVGAFQRVSKGSGTRRLLTAGFSLML